MIRSALYRLIMEPVLHVILVSVLLTLVFVPHVDRASSLEMIASNAVPVCVFGLLLLFFSGRPVTTIGVVLLVLATFELINERKSEILALPLSYNDTLMLGEFVKSPGLLLQYGSRVEILLVLLGIVAVLLLFRFERPVVSWRRRLTGTFVVGAGLLQNPAAGALGALAIV